MYHNKQIQSLYLKPDMNDFIKYNIFTYPPSEGLGEAKLMKTKKKYLEKGRCIIAYKNNLFIITI